MLCVEAVEARAGSARHKSAARTDVCAQADVINDEHHEQLDRRDPRLLLARRLSITLNYHNIASLGLLFILLIRLVVILKQLLQAILNLINSVHERLGRVRK